MMPARPIGPVASVIASTSGVDLDGLLVEQLHALAVAAEAHVDAALQLVEIVDVQRPAQFEHHVVGDVHQRGDRALAGALEALLHPLRRRRGSVHVADHAPGEAAAAVGSRDACTGKVASLCAGTGAIAGRRERRAGQRRDLARDAEHRQAIGAVGRQLDREHPDRRAPAPRARRARSARRPAARAARGDRRRARARAPSTACPSALDAAQRRRLDLDSARQLARPTSATGAFMPAATFGAPQTIASGLALPRIDLAHREPVGVRMRRDFEHLDRPPPSRTAGATGSSASTSSPDMVSRCASSSVVNAGSTRVRSQLSENCMPRDQANCRRKRRSPSKNRRRSLMP